MEYYVYGLEDPRLNEVFYIGKGKGRRAESHLREVLVEGHSNYGKINRIQNIASEGLSVNIIYYAKDLHEEAALFLEEILIDRIGRKFLRHGPLENWLVGGVNQDKNKITLEEDQKTSIEYAVSKYPFLKDIILRVNRTTKEDEIKLHFRQNVTQTLSAISILAPDILQSIDAKEIRYLDHPLGNAIQFECKFGWGEFAIDLGQKLEYLRRISIYIKKDDTILFKTKFDSNQYSSIRQFRKYLASN